jgi:hypothetical protein
VVSGLKICTFQIRKHPSSYLPSLNVSLYPRKSHSLQVLDVYPLTDLRLVYDA